MESATAIYRKRHHSLAASTRSPCGNAVGLVFKSAACDRLHLSIGMYWRGLILFEALEEINFDTPLTDETVSVVWPDPGDRLLISVNNNVWIFSVNFLDIRRSVASPETISVSESFLILTTLYSEDRLVFPHKALQLSAILFNQYTAPGPQLHLLPQHAGFLILDDRRFVCLSREWRALLEIELPADAEHLLVRPFNTPHDVSTRIYHTQPPIRRYSRLQGNFDDEAIGAPSAKAALKKVLFQAYESRFVCLHHDGSLLFGRCLLQPTTASSSAVIDVSDKLHLVLPVAYAASKSGANSSASQLLSSSTSSTPSSSVYELHRSSDTLHTRSDYFTVQDIDDLLDLTPGLRGKVIKARGLISAQQVEEIGRIVDVVLLAEHERDTDKESDVFGKTNTTGFAELAVVIETRHLQHLQRDVDASSDGTSPHSSLPQAKKDVPVTYSLAILHVFYHHAESSVASATSSGSQGEREMLPEERVSIVCTQLSTLCVHSPPSGRHHVKSTPIPSPRPGSTPSSQQTGSVKSKTVASTDVRISLQSISTGSVQNLLIQIGNEVYLRQAHDISLLAGDAGVHNIQVGSSKLQERQTLQNVHVLASGHLLSVYNRSTSSGTDMGGNSTHGGSTHGGSTHGGSSHGIDLPITASGPAAVSVSIKIHSLPTSLLPRIHNALPASVLSSTSLQSTRADTTASSRLCLHLTDGVLLYDNASVSRHTARLLAEDTVAQCIRPLYESSSPATSTSSSSAASGSGQRITLPPSLYQHLLHTQHSPGPTGSYGVVNHAGGNITIAGASPRTSLLHGLLQANSSMLPTMPSMSSATTAEAPPPLLLAAWSHLQVVQSTSACAHAVRTAKDLLQQHEHHQRSPLSPSSSIKKTGALPEYLAVAHAAGTVSGSAAHQQLWLYHPVTQRWRALSLLLGPQHSSSRARVVKDIPALSDLLQELRTFTSDESEDPSSKKPCQPPASRSKSLYRIKSMSIDENGEHFPVQLSTPQAAPGGVTPQLTPGVTPRTPFLVPESDAELPGAIGSNTIDPLIVGKKDSTTDSQRQQRWDRMRTRFLSRAGVVSEAILPTSHLAYNGSQKTPEQTNGANGVVGATTTTPLSSISSTPLSGQHSSTAPASVFHQPQLKRTGKTNAVQVLALQWFGSHSIVLLTKRRSQTFLEVVSRDNVSASSVSITQQQQGSLAPRLHRLVPLPPGYAPTHLDTLTLSCDYDEDHVIAGAGGGTRSNRSRHVSTTTTTNATGTTATNSTLPNEQLPQHQPRSTRMYEQCIVTLRNEKDVLAFQVTAFVEPDASSDPAQSGGLKGPRDHKSAAGLVQEYGFLDLGSWSLSGVVDMNATKRSVTKTAPYLVTQPINANQAHLFHDLDLLSRSAPPPRTRGSSLTTGHNHNTSASKPQHSSRAHLRVRHSPYPLPPRPLASIAEETVASLGSLSMADDGISVESSNHSNHSNHREINTPITKASTSVVHAYPIAVVMLLVLDDSGVLRLCNPTAVLSSSHYINSFNENNNFSSHNNSNHGSHQDNTGTGARAQPPALARPVASAQSSAQLESESAGVEVVRNIPPVSNFTVLTTASSAAHELYSLPLFFTSASSSSDDEGGGLKHQLLNAAALLLEHATCTASSTTSPAEVRRSKLRSYLQHLGLFQRFGRGSQQPSSRQTPPASQKQTEAHAAFSLWCPVTSVAQRPQPQEEMLVTGNHDVPNNSHNSHFDFSQFATSLSDRIHYNAHDAFSQPVQQPAQQQSSEGEGGAGFTLQGLLTSLWGTSSIDDISTAQAPSNTSAVLPKRATVERHVEGKGDADRDDEYAETASSCSSQSVSNTLTLAILPLTEEDTTASTASPNWRYDLLSLVADHSNNVYHHIPVISYHRLALPLHLLADCEVVPWSLTQSLSAGLLTHPGSNNSRQDCYVGMQQRFSTSSSQALDMQSKHGSITRYTSNYGNSSMNPTCTSYASNDVAVSLALLLQRNLVRCFEQQHRRSDTPVGKLDVRERLLNPILYEVFDDEIEALKVQLTASTLVEDSDQHNAGSQAVAIFLRLLLQPTVSSLVSSNTNSAYADNSRTTIVASNMSSVMPTNVTCVLPRAVPPSVVIASYEQQLHTIVAHTPSFHRDPKAYQTFTVRLHALLGYSFPKTPISVSGATTTTTTAMARFGFDQASSSGVLGHLLGRLARSIEPGLAHRLYPIVLNDRRYIDESSRDQPPVEAISLLQLFEGLLCHSSPAGSSQTSTCTKAHLLTATRLLTSVCDTLLAASERPLPTPSPSLRTSASTSEATELRTRAGTVAAIFVCLTLLRQLLPAMALDNMLQLLRFLQRFECILHAQHQNQHLPGAVSNRRSMSNESYSERKRIDSKDLVSSNTTNSGINAHKDNGVIRPVDIRSSNGTPRNTTTSSSASISQSTNGQNINRLIQSATATPRPTPAVSAPTRTSKPLYDLTTQALLLLEQVRWEGTSGDSLLHPATSSVRSSSTSVSTTATRPNSLTRTNISSPSTTSTATTSSSSATSAPSAITSASSASEDWGSWLYSTVLGSTASQPAPPTAPPSAPSTTTARPPPSQQENAAEQRQSYQREMSQTMMSSQADHFAETAQILALLLENSSYGHEDIVTRDIQGPIGGYDLLNRTLCARYEREDDMLSLGFVLLAGHVRGWLTTSPFNSSQSISNTAAQQADPAQRMVGFVPRSVSAVLVGLSLLCDAEDDPTTVLSTTTPLGAALNGHSHSITSGNGIKARLRRYLLNYAVPRAWDAWRAVQTPPTDSNHSPDASAAAGDDAWQRVLRPMQHLRIAKVLQRAQKHVSARLSRTSIQPDLVLFADAASMDLTQALADLLVERVSLHSLRSLVAWEVAHTNASSHSASNGHLSGHQIDIQHLDILAAHTNEDDLHEDLHHHLNNGSTVCNRLHVMERSENMLLLTSPNDGRDSTLQRQEMHTSSTNGASCRVLTLLRALLVALLLSEDLLGLAQLLQCLLPVLSPANPMVGTSTQDHNEIRFPGSIAAKVQRLVEWLLYHQPRVASEPPKDGAESAEFDEEAFYTELLLEIVDTVVFLL